jgi:hypothetical protein
LEAKKDRTAPRTEIPVRREDCRNKEDYAKKFLSWLPDSENKISLTRKLGTMEEKVSGERFTGQKATI